VLTQRSHLIKENDTDMTIALALEAISTHLCVARSEIRERPATTWNPAAV